MRICVILEAGSQQKCALKICIIIFYNHFERKLVHVT